MELFPAANEDQLTLIKRVIEASDFYIVIVAGRFRPLQARHGRAAVREGGDSGAYASALPGASGGIPAKVPDSGDISRAHFITLPSVHCAQESIAVPASIPRHTRLWTARFLVASS